MLIFDPANPFPLISRSGGVPYTHEKAHARAVDDWLGFDMIGTEALVWSGEVDDGHERWLKQGPDTFLTPYTEIRRMLNEVMPHLPMPAPSVVDLGAGYGRLGFVLARHYPEARFLGLELVPERVTEGMRVFVARGLPEGRASLRVADLSVEAPPPADLYFLYDYGVKDAIRKTLADLRAQASAGRVVRLVGRGRAIRDLVEREHPWLGAVVEPAHHGNFSVYRSAEG